MISTVVFNVLFKNKIINKDFDKDDFNECFVPF